MHYESDDGVEYTPYIIKVLVCGSFSLLGSAVKRVMLEYDISSEEVRRFHFVFQFEIECLLKGLDLHEEIQFVKECFPNCGVGIRLKG